MPRRFASQVHQSIGRLVQSKHIRREPAWYQVVLDHPPPSLPPRATPARDDFDVDERDKIPRTKPVRMGTPKVRPLPVYYLEDDIRRQFFRDHPFEAYRPRILSEKGTVDDEHPVRGLEWTRLRQRGVEPSPETCVQFALNLHVAHEKPLSEAYELAVAQFRALRSEAHISHAVARLEALAYGAEFGATVFDTMFSAEESNMKTWDYSDQLDSGALAARKRWKAIIDRKQDTEFQRGEAYVSLWKKGVLPDYVPASATAHMRTSNLENALAEDADRK
ncbi:mitochondrial ribosomal protein S25-domain-containing protein [Auriculariales sp. MPI-PUGE-AT-0066]|nr:mitochondrial ribosomal protein S25-domain-containing protein [Auriculariales sp. MPI-PUGE-AT-0066]